MASGRFRVVLLLVVIIASSLLIDDVRSKVRLLLLAGTSLTNESYRLENVFPTDRMCLIINDSFINFINILIS